MKKNCKQKLFLSLGTLLKWPFNFKSKFLWCKKRMKILGHFICGWGFSRICWVRFPYQNKFSYLSFHSFFLHHKNYLNLKLKEQKSKVNVPGSKIYIFVCIFFFFFFFHFFFFFFFCKTILENLSNIVVCKMYPTCFLQNCFWNIYLVQILLRNFLTFFSSYCFKFCKLYLQFILEHRTHI